MLCPKCGGINDNLAAFCQYCGTNLKFDQAASSSQTTPSVNQPVSQVEYAGFWRRFAAAIIDALILAVLFNTLASFIPNLDSETTYRKNFFYLTVYKIPPNFLKLICQWIYFASLESSKYQATIGKMALGIIVTDLQRNKISFAQATGRHFAKIISALILFIGFIIAGFTEKKQGLHDIMSGCLVVMKNKS